MATALSTYGPPIQHMIPTAHLSPQPKRHPYRFIRLCTDNRSVPIFYNGTPIVPKNLPLPMGGSGPPSNTWFPGPTRYAVWVDPNGISIGSAVFAGLTSVTNRQTYTRSVTIGRIYVRSTAMRPNKFSVAYILNAVRKPILRLCRMCTTTGVAKL